MTSKDKREWSEKTLAPSMKEAERDVPFETLSGLPVDTVYAPDDLGEGWEYRERLGYPGEYPYTRGIYPNMYRGRLWTMRQYAGFSTPEESNRRYRYLLENGQTGLSVAFDLPTQTGYDSDHPLARGEVGKVGVPICSLRDMEVLFDGIPLERVTTSMTINATASILLALYVAVAKRQGARVQALGGTIQNDILKEYIARGTYIYPPRPSMRLIVDSFRWCAESLPKWNPISISGYHMREAGCTASQELAFTFSDAIEYTQAAIRAGLSVDSFAGRLSFFFASHNNLLEEVAKFRAARRMWAKIMRERFHARDPRSWTLRFHTQTAGVTLTAQQVENNVVRTTIQALAAVLGGTQSLHVNSKDEALALPTEESVQTSLRTQQILAFESGVTETADPLGGSYYVESLTDRLEAEAFEYIKRIDAMGGALAAIEQGYQMREIAEAAYRQQRDIESGRRVVVGVNRYQTEQPPVRGLLRVDQKAARRQMERLAEVRRTRDAQHAAAAMRRLKECAETEDAYTAPVILEAVEAYCTVGEICDVFRGAWGEMRVQTAI